MMFQKKLNKDFISKNIKIKRNTTLSCSKRHLITSTKLNITNKNYLINGINKRH